MPSNDLITMIAVMITLFGIGFTIMLWAINRVDSDIRSIGERVDKINIRLDGHASRIDQLYTMFIDLVKTTKG